MGLMNTFSNALSTLSNGFASMFGASKDHNHFQMFREGISGPPGNHIVTNPYPPPYQQPQDLDRYAGETNEMRIAYLKFHATEPAFQAAIDGKVASIAALDVAVLPADESSDSDKRTAEFIRDVIENSPGGWSGLITKILQPAFLLGFSVTEKWYAGVADEPYFVRIRPKWRGFWAPRRFASIDTNYLKVQLNDARELIGIVNTRRGLEGYTPERVIFYTNRKLFENPYGRSDGRSVYRACQLIDNAFKLWYIAMKNYSAPFLTGKTKSQGKIRAAFETALQNARAGGYILCADEDVVEVVNLAAATSFQAFKENIDKARQEVYLGVRGAFLPFLEGMQQDARGDTKVHKTASDAIEYLLVQGVCEVINHQVIPDLIISNFGDKCGIPTMTLGGTDWAETKAQLDVADILVNKFRIPVSRKSLYKVSQMEPPRDPEDEAGPAPLPPPPQNPPAGGFGFGQQFGSSGQGQPIQFVMMPYQSKPIAVEGGATANPVGTFSVANDIQQYADALITNEQGQVLLLKRKSTDRFHPNEWCLPGGKIENGEDPLKAASREVQEETGLTVGLRPHKSYQNDNGTISHTFAGDVGNAGVMLNGDEHTSHMWVDDTRKGYPRINFMLETKDRLDDYFNTSKETFSAEPTQYEESKTPSPKIAIAGEDGQTAIHLVKAAMDDGKAVLESISRDAVERKLAGHTGPLFNADETELLAEAIASTNATAELLGRYRIRERVKTQDQGKRFAALTPTSGPPLVKPLPPEAALEHFRALMPSLSPIPGFDERCRRTAFTLAVHTGEVMLRSMQDAIATALAEGRNGRKDVTDILTIAGVSPSNPQYADMVFRSNAVDALNAGFDDERQSPDVIEEFPAWEYLGIEDGREGDDHRPKFGNYYPANVTFAQARGPRLFNCRCSSRAISRREWARLVANGATFAAVS